MDNIPLCRLLLKGSIMRVVKTVVYAMWLFAVFLPVSVVAQDRDRVEERRDVFAPFVSRFRVAVRDPQVRITWRDSQDLEDGLYQVYRHDREITVDTFENATLIGTVESGVETFLDTPMEVGDYFYAVVAADPDGTVFPIFVPFRNKTIRPVTITRLETEEDLAARVYDIVAQAQDNAVVLRFNTSRGGRRLAVYRSTVPPDRIESPHEATLLEQIDSSAGRFIDYPVPGVEYYYGIFDVALVERGTLELNPGGNVLLEPVQITLRAARETGLTFPPATKRAAPLPVLELSGGIHGDQVVLAREVPHGGQPQAVRPVTDRAITRLLQRTPAIEPFAPQPVVLPPERADDGEGAERTLAQVIRDHFVPGEYATSINLLRNLLKFPLNAEFERRVRFYLAQALFFDGRREPAFVEFLLASEGSLYQETRPWIDGILQPRQPN